LNDGANDRRKNMPKRNKKKVARTATKGKKQSANTLNRTWTVKVETITFSGIIGIYYARIGPQNNGYKSFLAPPHADYVSSFGDFHHFSPEELRPATGTPHWKRKVGTNKREFSWPAAYARTGAAGGQSWKLKAKFSMEPKVSSVRKVKIKAANTAAGLEIVEREVEFKDGESQECEFDLKGVPASVQHFNEIDFSWVCEFCSESQPSTVTKHTLFILDEVPKMGNNSGAQDGSILWDVYVWSCEWAKGKTGPQAVLDAIWGHFKPVQSGGHDTGLVYWKNQNIGIAPKQDLVGALQSQDDPDPLKQNAASCKVFDFVLLNCLAAHGILSAEIELRPYPKWPPDKCTFSSKIVKITTWVDVTTIGQGNTLAPPIWENHWVANVRISGQWKIYDPSYGEGPVPSQAPVAPPSGPSGYPWELEVYDYEPLAVQRLRGFDCTDPMVPEFRVLLPLSPLRSGFGHLRGYYLWFNT